MVGGRVVGEWVVGEWAVRCWAVWGGVASEGGETGGDREGSCVIVL